MALVPARPRSSSPHRGVGTTSALAALGVLTLAAAHLLGQYTFTGRVLDGAAQSALVLRSPSPKAAVLQVLNLVTIPSVAVVFALLVGTAVVRRRWWSAAGVVVLMAGATLTTQALKHELLDRPEVPWDDRNGLPSGHSTVAHVTGLALLFVVPARWRHPTAGMAALLGASGGLATLLGGTHRPVDVAAAVGVGAVWAACAVLIARRDEPAAGPAWGGRYAREGAGATLRHDFRWAGAGVTLPVATQLAWITWSRPPGMLEAAVSVLVIAVLVATTVALVVHALRPPPAALPQAGRVGRPIRGPSPEAPGSRGWSTG